MHSPYEDRITLLSQPENKPLLTGILRGIEKESLRTTAHGNIALTPHPTELGSALTHPQITTDFSEALVEFITPPSHQIQTMLKQLQASHQFCQSHIGSEMLWGNSMPCMVGDDDQIPVAQYGSTNRGKMKTAYRIGLGHRYGRTMQTVAGVHYNFSLPRSVWALLYQQENTVEELSDFIDRRYFDLIRNFRREYWLLIYLFGASPALCKSFVKGRAHSLVPLDDDTHTLHLPYATSLRMGDLGYQSSAQESLFVCYNSVESYVTTLAQAIHTPYPAYEKIGLKNAHGDIIQLNNNLLQIENEFYSAIRPKRVAQAGETALTALCRRGVEYIEVRCLDLDPYEALGIGETQIRFLDMFLVYCAVKDSPLCDREEFSWITQNQKQVVTEGRNPALELTKTDGQQSEQISLRAWGKDILSKLAPIATLFDDGKSDVYAKALAEQTHKIEDADATPSARVLADMRREGLSFAKWARRQSLAHQQTLLARPLSEAMTKRFEDIAEESLQIQHEEERKPQMPFDDYIKQYYEQYRQCCPNAEQQNY